MKRPVSVIAMVVISLVTHSLASASGQVLLGAIRWDAWHGPASEVGLTVERTLAPAHWHYRLPFYAKETGEDAVEVRGHTQAIIDQEIEYAHRAGIDYWAFVIYPEDNALSLGLKLYLYSDKKEKVNFCLNLQGGWEAKGGLEAWPEKSRRYIRYFTESTYQNVLGNRPLVYLYSIEGLVGPGRFEFWEDARAALDQLRAEAKSAGLGNPYIVGQGWRAETLKEQAGKLGLNAIGAYASSAGAKAGTYASLAAHTEGTWDTFRATGVPLVPLATTGWDNRPRIETPVPWLKDGDIERHYEAPRPEELAAHVKRAVSWCGEHAEAAEAQAILLYAWNEFDEGGWLCPTLAEGSARLDAIAEVGRCADSTAAGEGMAGKGHTMKNNDSITVASYYFPNYHPNDPRNMRQKGGPWCEWELVKNAKPRFEGHKQPKVPLWGYGDESDPEVMAMKIDAAANHGIDAFIFDWYYYEDGPFLNRCLDEGYLQAANRERVKFSLMWANHDWIDIFPYRRDTERNVLYPGVVSPEGFERIGRHVIRDYFLQPSYWRIDGKPYFSFYDLTKLMASFGSLGETRAALDRFRAMAREAGLPGLHLNAVVWGRAILPGEGKVAEPRELVRDLGFDSVTSYVWVHHAPLNEQQTDYNEVRDQYLAYWDRAEEMFDVPYFPNVTMGWDPSPRCFQEDEFGNFGYPFTNTIAGNTPERFREALEITRDRLLKRGNGPRIFNINCWNEWTEGSYLEPDAVNKMAYLEAVAEVFGISEQCDASL